MPNSLLGSTDTHFLDRLKTSPWDEAAWGELVRGYSPAIRRWCRCWGLQPSDADDVTQAVLLKLSNKMAGFRYDRSRSFRGYLKTLTRYAVRDALAALRTRGVASGVDTVDWLMIEDTRNELARCLEFELREDLLREALARVKRRADPYSVEIFLLFFREKLSGEEVAARTGKSVAAVYMAKSRMVRMLREEIRSLSRFMTYDP